MFQLRFRASELLDVREGSLPIIDIARRQKTVFLFFNRRRQKKETTSCFCFEKRCVQFWGL